MAILGDSDRRRQKARNNRKCPVPFRTIGDNQPDGTIYLLAVLTNNERRPLHFWPKDGHCHIMPPNAVP